MVGKPGNPKCGDRHDNTPYSYTAVLLWWLPIMIVDYAWGTHVCFVIVTCSYYFLRPELIGGGGFLASIKQEP